MTEIVSTRVTDNMAKDLEKIGKEEKTNRATVVRKLLAQAIADWKLNRALTFYSEEKITLWKAAKIAELPIWEMMEVIKQRKVPFRHAHEDFREDFEKALKEE